MAVPFDTLKLARRLESAGFEHKQAGDMAEAIAEAYATIHGNVATKADLRELREQLEHQITRMTLRLGSMIAGATAILIAIKFFA